MIFNLKCYVRSHQKQAKCGSVGLKRSEVKWNKVNSKSFSSELIHFTSSHDITSVVKVFDIDCILVLSKIFFF